MDIYSDIGVLKGVGPKAKETLNKCGIFNILDLLLYFPRDYENIKDELDIEELDEKEKVAIECKFLELKRDTRTKTGKVLSTLIFEYKGNQVVGKWFNQPYMKNNFKVGNSYRLLGKFKKVGKSIEVVNPIIACKDIKESGLIAKYSLKDALTNKVISKLINQILDSILVSENLPTEILDKYKMCSLDFAIRNIHFPKNMEDLNKAIVRLKFQELFTYSFKILMLKKHIKSNSKGIAFMMDSGLSKLKENLPFNLTEAQSRVVREILIDQKRPFPMNRLVQGDVGSGKTIVAIIAMFNVIKNGYQAVFMAPTEILANQHYEEVSKLLKAFDIKVELLTGGTSNKEKLRIKDEIRDGIPMIVVGTHALIEDDVEFKKLGMIITDEQHRFGVHQRSKLINKNASADVLVMTATPIPRTLSLYLYGDLDISIIDELPPGRQKIDTKFFQIQHRSLAYELALEEVNKGRQVYIVCPLIEENEELKLNSVEKLYNELKNNYFSNISLEILHGKMNGKTKDDVMQRFKAGEVKVLISTTVIEVGVNVPNATVMIIENSERFGLSQLHQLRGRVGRGIHKSYCILIGDAKNNVTKQRMSIMTQSNDGFLIAEQDLKLRGTGELFGLRQHGDSGLILADVVQDIELLKAANFECQKIINDNGKEFVRLSNEIKNNLDKTSKYICFN